MPDPLFTFHSAPRSLSSKDFPSLTFHLSSGNPEQPWYYKERSVGIYSPGSLAMAPLQAGCIPQPNVSYFPRKICGKLLPFCYIYPTPLQISFYETLLKLPIEKVPSHPCQDLNRFSPSQNCFAQSY